MKPGFLIRLLRGLKNPTYHWNIKVNMKSGGNFLTNCLLLTFIFLRRPPHPDDMMHPKLLHEDDHSC